MAYSNPSSSLVICVECKGVSDISQLTYDVDWQNLSVMLRIKYDFEDECKFTYSDEDNDTICLDSQESLEEALHVARSNNDVLHVQIWPSDFDLSTVIHQNHSRYHDIFTGVDSSARPPTISDAVGTTLHWASHAVKTAARGILNHSSMISSSVTGGGRYQHSMTMSSLDMTEAKTPLVVTSSSSAVDSNRQSQQQNSNSNSRGDNLTETPSPPAAVAVVSPVQCDSITSSVCNTAVDTTQVEEVTVTTRNTHNSTVTSTTDINEVSGQQQAQLSSNSIQEMVETSPSTADNTIKHPSLDERSARIDAEDDEDDTRLEFFEAPQVQMEDIELASIRSIQHASSRQNIDLNDSVLECIKREVRLAVQNQLRDRSNEVSTSGIAAHSSSTLDNTVQDDAFNRKQTKTEIKQLKQKVKELKHKMKANRKRRKKLVKRNRNTSSMSEMSIESNEGDPSVTVICENYDIYSLNGPAAVVPNQVFTKYWLVKNETNQVWDENTILVRINSQEDEAPSIIADVQAPLVKIGEVGVLSVTLTAPNSSCQFTTVWRLRTREQFFGPELSCEVIVEKTRDESTTPVICDQLEYQEIEHTAEVFSPAATEVTSIHAVESFTPLDSLQHSLVDESIESENKQIEAEVESTVTELPSHSIDDKTSNIGTDINDDCEGNVSDGSSDAVVMISDAEPDEEEEQGEDDNDGGNVEVPDHHDDTDSVASDFEVIPVPECFDMSRPLDSSTHQDTMVENEVSPSNSLMTNQSRLSDEFDHIQCPNTDVGGQSLHQVELEEVPTYAEATSPQFNQNQVAELANGEENAGGDSSSESDNSDDEEEFQPAADSLPESTTSSRDAPVTPQLDQQVAHLSTATTSPSVEQQVVTPSPPAADEESRPIVAPLPVPASVVNQDTPYNLPRLPVTTQAEPWTPAHIPLPTGVVNVDEPWQPPQSQVEIPSSFEDISLRHGRTESVQADSLSTSEVQTFVENNNNTSSVSRTEQDEVTQITVPVANLDLTPSGFQPYSDEFTFHDELNGLLDMGFNDVVINKMLLRQFEGDVNRCVNALLTRGGGSAPSSGQRRSDDGHLA